MSAARFKPGDSVDVLVATRRGPEYTAGFVVRIDRSQHGARVAVKIKGGSVLRFCHPSSVRLRVDEPEVSKHA